MMKKLRSILLACLLGVCSIFASACYITQSQTMKNIQGTYKLTNYKRTDETYDKDDKKVTTVTDLIETKGLEVYLVVTGNSTGYYAYKANDTQAYVKEVALTYQADSEDGSKYSYVGYKDASAKDYENRGVTKNSLNFYRPAICGKLFNQPVYQAGYDEHWNKVDKATDLSYVKEQWGEVPVYSYEGWMKEGGYTAYCQYDATLVPEGESFVDPYQYYMFVLDTAKMKATTYYALASDGVPQKKTENVTLVDGWATIRIGEETWTVGEYGLGYISTEKETENGIAYKINASRVCTLNATADIESRVENYQNQE